MKKKTSEVQTSAKKKNTFLPNLLKVLACLLVLAVLVYSVFFIVKGATKNKITLKKIKNQWAIYNYQEVYNLSKAYLQNKPFNNTALTYYGYACFYLAVSQNDTYQAHEYLDESILNLRLAMYNADQSLIPQLEYMLGKAYFYKSSISNYYYSDLAIKYLTAAKEHNYEAEDIAERLGLSYAALGMTMESISAFSEALLYRESENLLLDIAVQYYKAGEYNASEQYLYRIISTTENDTILMKAKNLLGNLYLDKEDFENAEKVYTEILEFDDNSADAHYGLGVIQEKRGNLVKARTEWKKTLKIQPNHAGARKKLSE